MLIFICLFIANVLSTDTCPDNFVVSSSGNTYFTVFTQNKTCSCDNYVGDGSKLRNIISNPEVSSIIKKLEDRIEILENKLSAITGGFEDVYFDNWCYTDLYFVLNTFDILIQNKSAERYLNITTSLFGKMYTINFPKVNTRKVSIIDNKIINNNTHAIIVKLNINAMFVNENNRQGLRSTEVSIVKATNKTLVFYEGYETAWIPGNHININNIIKLLPGEYIMIMTKRNYQQGSPDPKYLCVSNVFDTIEVVNPTGIPELKSVSYNYVPYITIF